MNVIRLADEGGEIKRDFLDRTIEALAQCEDISEVKQIHDQLAFIKEVLIRRKANRRQQNIHAAATIETECLLGKALAEGPKDKGGRPSKTCQIIGQDISVQKKLGISRDTSSRWQIMHAMPGNERTKAIEEAINDDTAKIELTSKLIYELARKLMREEERNRIIESTPETGGDIVTGDLDQLFDLVPAETADLFFTDPPYHEIHTDLFGRLAELAQAKLKPSGLCLVYSGQMFLPTVLAEMSRHLDYYWLFALRHTGGHLDIWNRKVWNDWKPILVFAKRPVPSAPDHDWVQDFREGGGRDKDYHEWGQDAQEATYWIEKLTKPGDLVIDPFAGGGAIPAACKATNRRWLATELNSGNAAIARNRVS